MEFGVTVRNMGTQSTREMLAQCALTAQTLGFESIWITDHIAIPPDDAEGSGGRYLETLTTLAWLAGVTKTIKLGSGVLILPYRAALVTAKQIATVQELSANRLLLGVGIGWMDAEFRALGLERSARSLISAATLTAIHDCFADDEVEMNGQAFLFKPRPKRPPILIGGRPPHALQRAARFGDGWLPMVRTPEDLRASVPAYREITQALGKPNGEITAMTSLPLDQAEAGLLCEEYDDMQVDRLVCSVRYDTVAEFRARLESIAIVRDALK